MAPYKPQLLMYGPKKLLRLRPTELMAWPGLILAPYEPAPPPASTPLSPHDFAPYTPAPTKWAARGGRATGCTLQSVPSGRQGGLFSGAEAPKQRGRDGGDLRRRRAACFWDVRVRGREGEREDVRVRDVGACAAGPGRVA